MYMDTRHPAADNVFIRQATKIAIGAVTILMLLMAVIFWRQNQASEEARGWVNHTYYLIGHLELLYGSLRDAELGKRGYLLTGDEAFLETYENALKEGKTTDNDGYSLRQHHSIMQELTIIRKLTADNPSQQSNLDEMDEAVTKLLKFMKDVIQIKRAEKDKRAVPNVNFVYGKELMDRIRSLVRIMKAEENHLLSLRIEVADNNAQQSSRLTMITMMVVYL